MLRFLAIFLLILQTLIYAGGKSPFKEYKTQLLSINGKEGKIKNSDYITVGSSGIVTHSFDDETTTIVARAVVTKKEGENAIIEFEVFDMLSQAAFPLPGIMPKVGDEITLNYLYDRALIVAPNEMIFNEVTNHFSGITWVHPDLMAAYLATEHKPNPGRNNFDMMCRQNSTGLIFFALDMRGFFADCQSLTVLKSIKSGPIASYQLPFYNRIGGIDTVFWKWSGSQIRNYNAHYARLLGL